MFHDRLEGGAGKEYGVESVISMVSRFCVTGHNNQMRIDHGWMNRERSFSYPWCLVRRVFSHLGVGDYPLLNFLSMAPMGSRALAR